ncbi:putative NAP1-binding protein [Clavispora lusitaniae]|uniref:SH3 domain-containing protein n=3 Tax=Clavispora lusitaniae TaxID=36911 RepID=C4Y0A9_CLAL4|nr:uncharacterized protein CLUG_01641 [Clavispora lusitaniae ATCC 42720]KAF5212119.1 HOG (high osmolarity glycerol) pathway protein [Clavispora lusitaniae]EEQ37518.1 hypothetical protein CLUG_01641 [Clavispora lusitaniae ATCC 42720]KAF7583521.1 Variant SH3 domain family protein [Clavispora lusitaniae]OVF07383.1 putative NAP1-binding protein [Clavispora lusitaniae]QFZ26521.1 putative NAP1-binding protein [Clavispora lusitaniae]
MSPSGEFPPSTVIKDFAYPESHPLRSGNYPSEGSSDDELDVFSTHSHVTSSGDTQIYSSDEINRRAVALFDFEPENDNEVALFEGQVIWISYRHGQGWLVAEDPDTGENGLVPEEYVDIFYDEDTGDVAKPFMPQILQQFARGNESEWEDVDEDETEDVHTESPGDNGASQLLSKKLSQVTLETPTSEE